MHLRERRASASRARALIKVTAPTRVLLPRGSQVTRERGEEGAGEGQGRRPAEREEGAEPRHGKRVRTSASAVVFSDPPLPVRAPSGGPGREQIAEDAAEKGEDRESGGLDVDFAYVGAPASLSTPVDARHLSALVGRVASAFGTIPREKSAVDACVKLLRAGSLEKAARAIRDLIRRRPVDAARVSLPVIRPLCSFFLVSDGKVRGAASRAAVGLALAARMARAEAVLFAEAGDAEAANKARTWAESAGLELRGMRTGDWWLVQNAARARHLAVHRGIAQAPAGAFAAEFQEGGRMWPLAADQLEKDLLAVTGDLPAHDPLACTFRAMSERVRDRTVALVDALRAVHEAHSGASQGSGGKGAAETGGGDARRQAAIRRHMGTAVDAAVWIATTVGKSWAFPFFGCVSLCGISAEHAGILSAVVNAVSAALAGRTKQLGSA